MELGIDFGGTEIKIAVIDGDTVVASDSIPVFGDATDLARARQAAHLLTTRADVTPTALGIAVPGVVQGRRMLHANAKYDFLRAFDLIQWAADDFGLPAVVENDARAALIGETSIGSAAGERDAVLITLGTGIGTAAMIDGIPLRGRTGHAGILGGHVTIDLDGPTCPCGNIGCGEAQASTWALREAARGGALRQAQRASAQGHLDHLTMRDVFADDAHLELRERFLHVWGAVVTTLVHMYDPAVVILSGGILRAGDAVRAPIEQHVRDHLWPSVRPPRFVVPSEPELSVVRGLSALARAIATPPRLDDHPDLEEQ